MLLRGHKDLELVTVRQDTGPGQHSASSGTTHSRTGFIPSGKTNSHRDLPTSPPQVIFEGSKHRTLSQLHPKGVKCVLEEGTRSPCCVWETPAKAPCGRDLSEQEVADISAGAKYENNKSPDGHCCNACRFPKASGWLFSSHYPHTNLHAATRRGARMAPEAVQALVVGRQVEKCSRTPVFRRPVPQVPQVSLCCQLGQTQQQKKDIFLLREPLLATS